MKAIAAGEGVRPRLGADRASAGRSLRSGRHPPCHRGIGRGEEDRTPAAGVQPPAGGRSTSSPAARKASILAGLLVVSRTLVTPSRSSMRGIAEAALIEAEAENFGGVIGVVAAGLETFGQKPNAAPSEAPCGASEPKRPFTTPKLPGRTVCQRSKKEARRRASMKVHFRTWRRSLLARQIDSSRQSAGHSRPRERKSRS